MQLRKLLVSFLFTLIGWVAVAAQPALSFSKCETARNEVVNAWMAKERSQYLATWNNRVVTIDSLNMPFWVHIYGNKPAGGYSLFISLHGGGNAPADVNNQQWQNQMLLYQPANSVYLVPRAPYNDWDMWFKPKLDKFYEQLIQMAIVLADVNPDRVYIMGYSAGGDGVWRMAPRMADYWAAASMMAGHPGDVKLLNLRNTPFMIWCGALDSAYNRNKLCAGRAVQMDSLQQADQGGYVHQSHIVPGKPHWMDRVDTAAVSWMQHFTRNPYPRQIVWCQEQVLRPWFYWLQAPSDELQRGKTVRLGVEGNQINITQCDYSCLTLWLNDSLVDLDKPVEITFKGNVVYKGKLKRTRQNLEESINLRNDPRYAMPARITVNLK